MKGIADRSDSINKDSNRVIGYVQGRNFWNIELEAGIGER